MHSQPMGAGRAGPGRRPVMVGDGKVGTRVQGAVRDRIPVIRFYRRPCGTGSELEQRRVLMDAKSKDTRQ